MSKRSEHLQFLKDMCQSFNIQRLKEILEEDKPDPKVEQHEELHELFHSLGVVEPGEKNIFPLVTSFFNLQTDRHDKVHPNDTELSVVVHSLLHLKQYQGQLILFSGTGWNTVTNKTLNEIINAISVVILNTQMQNSSKLKQICDYLEGNAPSAEPIMVKSHIQLQNGCFNTRTGDVERHSPERLPMIRLDADLKDFKPSETSIPEVFHKFIKESVLGDQVYYDYLLDVYASLLDPSSPTSIKAGILKGSGGNGKSILADLLEKFFQPSNVTVKSLDDMGKNFGLENFNRAMINISHELSSSSPKPEAVRQLKRLLDNKPGPTEVNEKYKKPQNWVIDIKMLFASNSVVNFGKANKQALSRRVTILPFNFTPNIIDYELPEKLLKEKEPILAYLLGRIADIHQRGHLLQEPEVVQHSKEMWFSTDSYIHSDPQLTQEILNWLYQHVEKVEGEKVDRVKLAQLIRNEIPKATSQKCNKIIENLLKFNPLKHSDARYWKDMQYKPSVRDSDLESSLDDYY